MYQPSVSSVSGATGKLRGDLGETHIVHENGDFVDDIADQDHASDFVRPGPLLVDQSESAVESVSYRSCAFSAASVRADDDRLLQGQILLDPS